MTTELSPRQKEIFVMIANGHKVDYIADLFKCHPGTIDAHKKKACDRLGITGIAAITRYCIKKGWIEA